jgi:hypothetical protein
LIIYSLIKTINEEATTEPAAIIALEQGLNYANKALDLMYDCRAKPDANDIRLKDHLTVLGDILQDRKGVRCVRYLSRGTDFGVHAAAAGSEQMQGIL